MEETAHTDASEPAASCVPEVAAAHYAASTKEAAAAAAPEDPVSPEAHAALEGPAIPEAAAVAATTADVTNIATPAVSESPPPYHSAVVAPPETPKTPRHLRPTDFNRMISMDPGVHKARRASASTVSVASVRPLPEERPQIPQSPSSPSVCFKVAQFTLTLLCLGFVSDSYVLVSHNITAMHFPFIVFSSYTIITGVILFSYIVGMKMRELLIRVFGSLGGLLFLISAICTTNIALVYWVDWDGTYEEGDTEEINFDYQTIPRRQVCFAMQITLSFATSAVYLVDVVYSYRRTMQLLN